MGEKESRQEDYLSEAVGAPMIQHYATFLSLWILTTSAFGACILPKPDGGTANVSDRNVAGKIVKVDRQKVLIRDVTSKTTVRILIPKALPVFTAFGGDFPLDVLKVGQSARVWLKGCEMPANSRGTAAYFEIFSADVADAPDQAYFHKKGQ
jgi:hypothetical protein